MKKILFVLLAIIGLTSCGNNQNANAQTSTKAAQKEYVEVLYFHGKQRCVTCNAIEKLTKEVVEKDFAEQLKNGKVVFKVIDISTNEGEKIADMTDFGFSYAKGSPDVFKAGVKKKIDELLK